MAASAWRSHLDRLSNGPATPPPGASTFSVNASDGTILRGKEYGNQEARPVVLVHGWSGSSRSWGLNVTELASKGLRVVTYDQRGHGDSDKPAHGNTVARLAADLRDVLSSRPDLQNVTLVGASMGVAVILSYLELFGFARVSKLIFVDQAPLQNRVEGWTIGSKGCYDEASLLEREQHQVREPFPDDSWFGESNLLESSATRGLKRGCVSESVVPFNSTSYRRDHTQLDWRPLLPTLKGLPILNCVGGVSAVFPEEGCLEIGRLAPSCTSVVFANANHWLYLEEPAKFNNLVIQARLPPSSHPPGANPLLSCPPCLSRLSTSSRDSAPSPPAAMQKHAGFEKSR
ncbi:Alpha/Beta hydrolase protein [Baffinella frigidus]|nr:Alpha/Beta hydrolase protein [Cryptophyta sp. CCMP2293]